MAITLASSIEHERRRAALRACGVDPELPMTRASSYANEVWVGDELVLRINARGVGRLGREARIVRALPAEARVPEVVDLGNDGEIEWMLARRVPGIELGRAWAAIEHPARERAIHELAEALAAIHQTPCRDIPDDIEPPHTLPLEPLVALVDKVCPDPEVAEAITAFLRDRWSAFDDSDRGLVHGDPHLENVLWDGTRITAMLDFEWSRPSWIHCDLETLVSVAEAPRLFVAADYEHELDPEAFADIPRWLAAAQPRWFDHPRLADRLALLYVSRQLGCFEDAIDPDDPVLAWRWERIAAVVGGEPLLRG